MNINSLNNWLVADSKNPILMGILNVTPDSFSDGGKFYVAENAIMQAIKMESEGADIIDIGGESTRPGAKPVNIDDELKRVIPVIEGIRKRSDIIISIDTQKSTVAEKAILAGANIINDISGLRFDENMIQVANRFQIPIVVMHMMGNPQNMQYDPAYTDLIDEIITFFKERIIILTEKGIRKKNIILDPGLGFGKTINHNFKIIRELRQIVNIGFPVLIGPSRKSFIGKTLNLEPIDTIEGTAATVAAAVLNGANIIRVHDIKEMVRVLSITGKIIVAT